MTNTTGHWELETHQLSSEKLTDRLQLGQGETVTFHWADFSEACGLWQARIDREPSLRADYHSRVREIEKLRQLAVWIRHNKRVTQTNLHELYDAYIREKTWHGEGLLPDAPQEISFVSPSGPFKPMAVTDCFHQRTYQDFVLVLLLQNKLARRNFRLRVKSRVLVEYGPGLQEAGLAELEQVTTAGLLFKLSSEMFFAGMNPHHQVRFLFNSRPLNAVAEAVSFEQGIQRWSTNPFYTHDKAESFVLDCSQARVSGRGGQSYLFISYEQIEAANPQLAQSLKSFIASGESTVRRLLGTPRAA